MLPLEPIVRTWKFPLINGTSLKMGLKVMCKTVDLCQHPDTHMKVMTNKWKVIISKKLRLSIKCFPGRILKIKFGQTS